MQAFILSHFNFCSSVWHYCSMRDLRKIEKLQYKALKYVYNDFKSSYTDLRKMANRPLMYIERQKCILLEVFKCLNQISPRYLHDMFEIKVMPYRGVPRIWEGGGGQEFFFQIWEFAKPCALLGGFGGMLPREIFLKRCNLVRFRVYFAQILSLFFLKITIFYIKKLYFRYTLAMGYFL